MVRRDRAPRPNSRPLSISRRIPAADLDRLHSTREGAPERTLHEAFETALEALQHHGEGYRPATTAEEATHKE